MLDDYMSDKKTEKSSKKVLSKPSQPQEKPKPEISQDIIEQWLEEETKFYNNKICLVLGEDGTGKTGLVLDYVSKQLEKDKNAKTVLIDLDRGARTLIGQFHKKYHSQYKLFDPREKAEYVSQNGEILEDPVKVMKFIMHIAVYVRNNYKEKGYKFVILDGLSKLLDIAESQMRLDMNKEITDGIQQLYWKKRKENFFKVMNLLATIPIDIFYIGHTNFILEEKSSAITRDTNAMMAQRILCEKDEGLNNEVTLFGTVNKSRDNPLKVNDRKPFMQVKEGKFKFNSDKVFEGL